mgnify:CR=1 FL=1
MAYYFNEVSHTFNEYLLVPGYSSAECIPANVSLKTPLVKFKRGEEPAISMNIPLTSAIMQSVSGDRLAVALAREGGVSFIYGSQSIEDEAAMVERAKSYKAGFVVSESNVTPDSTLKDILELKAKNGHSTVAVTSDGEPNGKLLGIVTSRDYRVSRMSEDTLVSDFMTPLSSLIVGEEETTLKQANDIIWDHKLNSLPIVDRDGNLKYFVFRKDYDAHKENPNELLDSHKRYVVGAGINTRDYEERVPALINAGADVLCIDSSEGFSEWQARTLKFIREKYNVRIGLSAAEELKRSIGCVIRRPDVGFEEIKGRDLSNGLPKTVQVSSTELIEAFVDPMNRILEAIHTVLERTPPQLVGDLDKNGIIMSGGGSLIYGIDRLIERSTGIRTVVVDDAVSCAAYGAGKMLMHLDDLQDGMMNFYRKRQLKG